MAPEMVSVKVNTDSHLLEASSSTVGFSSSEYGGGTHRSRESSDSFWDDEE